MKFIKVIGLLIVILFISCHTQQSSVIEQLNGSDTSHTIAFGSCNKQWEPQPMWASIVSNDPDLWIWTGDIIYADTDDRAKMKAMYDQQQSNAQYKLLKDQCPIIGIWDDHDYGVNNGGKEYTAKDQSKALLFEFLKVPEANPAWQRKGAYQSYVYEMGEVTVKVILLDIRYFRDPRSNPEGTILGDAQWKWFEQELQNSTADINLIAGGIQFLHLDHDYEKWSIYPKEYARFLRVLSESSAMTPILISGDRHIAEIAKATLPNGQAIYEVTSSGLTHSYSDLQSEANRYRVGPLVTQKNFGMIKIDEAKSSLSIEIRNVKNEVLSSVAIMMN